MLLVLYSSGLTVIDLSVATTHGIVTKVCHH